MNRNGQTSAAYQYEAGGALRFVDQTGGTLVRDISFANDAGGKVLERSDDRGPKQRYFRFGGIDMGSIGNDGSDNVDYDAAITARNISTGTGAYRGGATIGTPYADFDQSFDSVNPANEAPTGSYYTVRTGDTLQSVAQAMWGDGSLWYLLAEANGLSAGSVLSAGQGLVVPEKGSNFRNTADTLRPYDASKAIGDTQPGAPKPPKGNKCGVVGQLILVAIAVAVTALTQQYGVFAALGPQNYGDTCNNPFTIAHITIRKLISYGRGRIVSLGVIAPGITVTRATTPLLLPA